MKLWIATLVAGACMTLGAYALLAQPADSPGDRGGRMERRGPADRPTSGDLAAPADRPAAGERDGKRDGAPADGKEGRKPPMGPMGPLMVALDTDKDGVLSAAEIAAATENLKKLDKNGDGKIDRVELLPPRPQGPQDGKGPQDGQGPQAGQGPQDGKGPRGGTAAQDGARRPPRGDAAADGPRPGPRGQRPGDRQPTTPPVAPRE